MQQKNKNNSVVLYVLWMNINPYVIGESEFDNS